MILHIVRRDQTGADRNNKRRKFNIIFLVTYNHLSMLLYRCMCKRRDNQQGRSYPRVTSFDALKQLTDICAHLITFSSRKYFILNKLSCFKSKHTFSEVREHYLFF